MRHKQLINKIEYNKKALEIVLPDVVITEDALDVLTNFKTVMEASCMEVWYIISK